MSSRCTHVGCPTQPNGLIFTRQRHGERTPTGPVALVPTQPSGFGCPCHGSQFDNEGNRTAGPAPRALDRYQFSIRHGHLWLGNLYSVSRVDGTGAQARIHAFALKGAGEPATGPESWLYPREIGWAETANERRYLQWELLACAYVHGVFRTAREDALAVLFDGGRRE